MKLQHGLSKKDLIKLIREQCRDCRGYDPNSTPSLKALSLNDIKHCTGEHSYGVCHIHQYRLLDRFKDALPPKQQIRDSLNEYCRFCLSLDEDRRLANEDCESLVCNLRINGYE